jgi:hypothetical protein
MCVVAVRKLKAGNWAMAFLSKTCDFVGQSRYFCKFPADSSATFR